MKRYEVHQSPKAPEGPYDESYIRLQYAYGAYSQQALVRAEGEESWQPLEAVFGERPKPSALAKEAVLPPASCFANPGRALCYMGMRAYSYKGRASRREFWMSFLGLVLLAIGLSIVLTALNLSELLPERHLRAAGNGTSAALVVGGLAVTTRRLHDIGMSGWWQLLRLIIGLGDLVILLLCCRRGNAGANRFGEELQG